MVVDDALRIAGGARRVVERDRLPLVGGWRPGGARIAAGEELLVLDVAQPLAAGPERVGQIDHRDAAPERRQRLLDGRRELGVGEEHLRFRVLEDERDRRGVETVVERVEHRARHRHAEVRLVHRRSVGRHHRDRVAAADAEARERRGEPARALVDLGPGVASIAVHHRHAIGERRRAAGQERERRERNVVRRVLVEVGLVRIHRCLHSYGSARRHVELGVDSSEVRRPAAPMWVDARIIDARTNVRQQRGDTCSRKF